MFLLRSLAIAGLSATAGGSRIRSSYGIEEQARGLIEDQLGGTSGRGRFGGLEPASYHAAALAQLAAGDYPRPGDADRERAEAKHFNCSRFPLLCEEPFDCTGVTTFDMIKWWTQGFGVDGHSNPKAYCMQWPELEPYVGRCLALKDPVGAGFVYYGMVDVGGARGEHFDGYDASACFINGMCDMPVTNDTTLEESDKMCDAMFGHETWTSFPSPAAGWRWDEPPFTEERYGMDDLLDPKKFTGMAKATLRLDLIGSCAMGSMHCDAIMCKETACKDVKAIAEYGHYLKEETLGKKARRALAVRTLPATQLQAGAP